MTRSSIVGALLVLSSACAERTGDIDPAAEVDTTEFIDTTGGETDGAAVLSPAGFRRRVAQAACARVFACCSPTERRRLFQTFPEQAVAEEADCEEYYAGLLGDFERGVAGSALAGRSEWDGEAAAACVARLEAMRCPEYAALLGPEGAGAIDCPLLTGKVSPAGKCRGDGECVRGFCRGATQWQDGACAALPAIGQPCPDNRCEAGARCDWSGAEPVCLALKADGEPCSASGECRSNGCSAPVFGTGVCGEARMCDGDPTNDEDVIAACARDMKDGRVQCKLASEGPWSCDCVKKGVVLARCSPGSTDPRADVCQRLNCCP